MFIATKVFSRAYTGASVRDIVNDAHDIPDEQALDPLNPEFSCVTCRDAACPDWGRRFCSCPDHQAGV
jgi:hypothetical protein